MNPAWSSSELKRFADRLVALQRTPASVRRENGVRREAETGSVRDAGVEVQLAALERRMTDEGLDKLLGLEPLLESALDRLAPSDASTVLRRIVAAFSALTNDRAKQAVRGRVLSFFERTVTAMLRGDRLDKVEPFVRRFADAVRSTDLVAGHPLGRVLRQVEGQMAASRKAAAEQPGLAASATGDEADERAEAFVRRLIGRRDLAASIAVSRVLGLDVEARSRRFVARFENRILRMNLSMLQRFDDAMQVADKALSFDRRFQMLGSLLAGAEDEGALGKFSWVLGLDLASGLAEGYDGELIGVEDLIFAHPAFQGDLGSPGLFANAMDGLGSLGLGGLGGGGLNLSSLGRLRRSRGLAALEKPVTKVSGRGGASIRTVASGRGGAGELPTVRARFGGRMVTLPKAAVKALRTGNLRRFETAVRSGLPAAAARAVLRSVRRQAPAVGASRGARLQLKGTRGPVASSSRLGGLSHLALGFQGLETGRARRQAASDLGRLIGRGGGAVGMVMPRVQGGSLGRGSALSGLARTGAALPAAALSSPRGGAASGLSSLGRSTAGALSYALPRGGGMSALGGMRRSQVLELAARGQIAPSVARMLLSAPRAGGAAAPRAARSVSVFAIANDGFGVPRFRAARPVSAAGVAALGGLDLGGSLVVRSSSARRGLGGVGGGFRFAAGASAPARFGASAVGGGFSMPASTGRSTAGMRGALPRQAGASAAARSGSARGGFAFSGLPGAPGFSGGLRGSLGAQIGAFGAAGLGGGYVRDGFGRIRPARVRSATGGDLSVIDASGATRVRVGGASSGFGGSAGLGGLRSASAMVSGAPALALPTGRLVAPALSLASGLGAFRGLVGGRRASAVSMSGGVGGTVAGMTALAAPHVVAAARAGLDLGLAPSGGAGASFGNAARMRRAGAGAFQLSSFDVAVGGGVGSLADLQRLADLPRGAGRGSAMASARGSLAQGRAGASGAAASDWVVSYDADRAGVTRMGAAAARDRQGAGLAASRVARFGQHASHLRDVYSGRRLTRSAGLAGAATRGAGQLGVGQAGGAMGGAQHLTHGASAAGGAQVLVGGAAGARGGVQAGLMHTGGMLGAQALLGAAEAHGSSQALASGAGAAFSGQALQPGAGTAFSGQARLPSHSVPSHSVPSHSGASHSGAVRGAFVADAGLATGAAGGGYLPARRATRRAAPRLMGVYGAPPAAADTADVLGLGAAGGFAARRAPARMAQRFGLLGFDAGADEAVVTQAMHSSGRRLDRHTGSRLRPYVGDVVDRALVHQGPAVDRAARALRSEAFAVGEEVFFASGAFDTTTREGFGRVAHELEHAARPHQRLHRLRDERSAPGEAAAESVGRQAAAATPAAIESGVVYGLVPKQISGQVRDRFRLDGWSPAQDLTAQAGRLSAGLGGSLPGERGVDLRIEHSFIRFRGDLPAGGSAASVPVDLTSQLTGRTELVARAAQARTDRGVSFALRNFEVPTEALFWGRGSGGEVEHRAVPVNLRYRTLEPERVWNDLELEAENGARGRARYQVRTERLGAPEGQLLEGAPAAQIRQVPGSAEYHGENVHVGADFSPARTDVRWSGGLGADVTDSEGFRGGIARSPFAVTLSQSRQEALGLDLTRAKALLQHNLSAVQEARRLYRAGVNVPVGSRWGLYLQAAPEAPSAASAAPEAGEKPSGWQGASLRGTGRSTDIGAQSLVGRQPQVADGAGTEAGGAPRVAGGAAPEQTLVQVAPAAASEAQEAAERAGGSASQQDGRTGGRAVSRAQRAASRTSATRSSQTTSSRAADRQSVAWVAPARHESARPAKRDADRRVYGFGGIPTEPVAGVQRKASTHWVADTKMQPGPRSGDRLARPEESRRPAAPPPNLTQLVYQIYNRLKREMEIDCERRTGSF